MAWPRSRPRPWPRSSPPGLCTLSVPANTRLPVKRQLSLPVTSQLANTPVIANKINPWPLDLASCDEEMSLMADNR